ncbi:MAG TPA: protocatechuate 3,4-dioxygenase subunit alpha [Nocardioidaceae bacterium]|nr:protocatechuate 3,4-dioxygenase subunit alpha [Nocardioidaceae bacterium]
MADSFAYPVTDVEASPGITPSQTVGPFFHYALPYDPGPAVAGPDRAGAVTLTGQVLDGQGEPVPDALVEIWQADERGEFVEQSGLYSEVSGDGFRGFGRCATDEHGRYQFRTVKPAGVPTADGRPQAPHIAMSVFARGMLRRVVTRVYFADESEANATDPLLEALDEARRPTLVATADGSGYRFDVRIQGADETVFLDVFAR